MGLVKNGAKTPKSILEFRTPRVAELLAGLNSFLQLGHVEAPTDPLVPQFKQILS